MHAHVWQSLVEIHWVFWIRYHVWSTVLQNVCWGRGSYVLRRHVNYLSIYAVRMNPYKSSVLPCFKHGKVIEIHKWMMFEFYLGLPNMSAVFRTNFWVWLCQIHTLQRPIHTVLPPLPRNVVPPPQLHLDCSLSNIYQEGLWLLLAAFKQPLF